MSPSNSTLTIPIEHHLYNSSYIEKPSIKSLILQFRLIVGEKPKWREFDFLCHKTYVKLFHDLETYLTENTEAALEELHIQFLPEVFVDLCIPNYNVVDYDRGGPIYEDEDWRVETRDHIPSEYFSLIGGDNDDIFEEIGVALLSLLSVRQWKAITLPYYFPAAALVAEKYPFATFTEHVDLDTVFENVVKSICKFHREHLKIERC
jgi:hypothetical protein